MGEHLGCEVLVAGAGPTGLTLACDLARRGVDVRIIDALPEPFAGSRGKGLQPRGLEVLDDLGVAGRLVATGRFHLPIRSYGGRFPGVRDLNPGAEAGPDRPYGRALMIPQWRIGEALRDRLAEFGVAVEQSTRLVSLTQDDHEVTATLENASGTGRCTARYLVGCDGGSSTVRKQLGIGFLGETDESISMFVGDVQLEGLDRDHWHVWHLPSKGMFALCPLPATDTFQLQAALPGREPSEPSLERFQAIVEECTGRTDIRLYRTTWESFWRSNVRMVDRYRDGRVFLAGDAAHVHSPAGAQGIVTGIGDAYNLGWKLGHVLAGVPETLLDTYELERLPIAANVLGLSSRIMAEGLGKRLHAGMGDETFQLGISYRDSSLTLGEAIDGRLSAGDRAPDAPCHDAEGNPVRLFDLFRGPHLTALAFEGRDTGLAQRLARRYQGRIHAHTIARPDRAVPDAVVDTEGHAHNAYDVSGPLFVVVRPDGHLAARMDEPDEAALVRHLDGVVPR